MPVLNRQEYQDKVYACWLGKNIGGTFGGPYEGAQELLDIRDFCTKPGEVLPNDDLDLQLIWLKAVQEQGIERICPELLGQYWLDWIVPHWNEYGICKANMKRGILPPMSGELDNEFWRNSNGAWIRTEIWACLTPGLPTKTAELSYYDACVDHGHGEGTTAAMFVAALESRAFLGGNMEELIDYALSKIPAESRTARSIRLAVAGYLKQKPWRETRLDVLEDSADLGWFQAPANVAYAVIGLLYGKLDFKKTMHIAVSCGDDTDCTGATVGSVLGILNGTAGIPKDWQQYLGDSIQTLSINRTFYRDTVPATITELTEQVMKEAERLSDDPAYPFELTDEKTENQEPEELFGLKTAEIMAQSGYSYGVENEYQRVVVDFEKAPCLNEDGEISFKLWFAPGRLNDSIPRNAAIRFWTPEGVQIFGKRSVLVDVFKKRYHKSIWRAVEPYTLKITDPASGFIRVVAEIQYNDLSEAIYLPLIFDLK